MLRTIWWQKAEAVTSILRMSSGSTDHSIPSSVRTSDGAGRPNT